MVSSPLSVVWACSFAVKLASPFGKHTASSSHVATVQADISDIAARMDDLYAAINGFQDPGGSIFAALAIHNAAISLNSAIKKGTIDAKNTGPVNDTDGITIYHSVREIVPVITAALEMIVVKKPAFYALPFVSGIGKWHVSTLNDSTSALEAALMAIAPASLQDDAMALKAVLDVAFEKAMAAYASA